MATGLGFCPNCGTPRVAAEQKFCPTCGAALAAISAPAPIAPPPAPPVEVVATPWAAETPQGPVEDAPPVEAAPPPPPWAATPPAPVEAAPPPPPWAATPPAPVEAAPPPPPAWAAAAASTPPPAPPADFAPTPPPWAAPAPVAPPPAPPTGYAPPPPPAWGAPVGQGYQQVPPQYPVAPMAPVAPAQTRSRTSPALLIVGLLLIVGIVAGGFYFLGNKGTPGSSGNPTVGPGSTNSAVGTNRAVGTNSAVGTGNPGGTGGGLSGAANNFSSIKSYKFSMTLAGGTFGSMLSAIPGAGSGDTPFTMSGIVTTNPQAADITMAGYRIIEIGGFEYIDLSGSGSFIKTASTGTSIAQSLSPATMFSSTMGTGTATGFSKVGTDTKNGVKADHYMASAAALAGFGASAGVSADATWSADVWIAQNGGYPVSMSILAVGSDKSVLYQITFDISNINDPSNNVTAPANAIGA